MTRKISLHLYITLDGYNEFPTYPGSDHPYPDEPELIAEEMWVKRWGTIDAFLFDSLTYEQWADFWPRAKRTDGEHPWIGQMSEFAERVQKIVFSDTSGKTDWANTRFIEGDLTQAVNRLKKEAGGGMAVVSPELGMEMTRRGLIDDYYFTILPVILGQGRRFFDVLESQRNLRLLEVKSFQYGEIFLHYQAVR